MTALRHASEDDGDVTLRLGRGEDRAVWMEVQDGTSALPHMREADMISEVGRGLVIVDYFTRCWGVRPLSDDAGKVVFAVIDPGA